MIEIELTEKEHSYISQTSFLPENFRNLLSPRKHQNDVYLLEISEELADEIRNLCGKQLQIAGFNKKREPTEEGKILESLMDKFFSS